MGAKGSTRKIRVVGEGRGGHPPLPPFPFVLPYYPLHIWAQSLFLRFDKEKQVFVFEAEQCSLSMVTIILETAHPGYKLSPNHRLLGKQPVHNYHPALVPQWHWLPDDNLRTHMRELGISHCSGGPRQTTFLWLLLCIGSQEPHRVCIAAWPTKWAPPATKPLPRTISCWRKPKGTQNAVQTMRALFETALPILPLCGTHYSHDPAKHLTMTKPKDTCALTSSTQTLGLAIPGPLSNK